MIVCGHSTVSGFGTLLLRLNRTVLSVSLNLLRSMLQFLSCQIHPSCILADTVSASSSARTAWASQRPIACAACTAGAVSLE
jgi:hypothetical protein